jgi:hypothetical protein
MTDYEALEKRLALLHKSPCYVLRDYNFPCVVCDTLAAIRDLRAERDAARKWILKCAFAGHHDWCGIRIHGSYGSCTCGRDTVL